jgi:methionyl-tRNA formyltransferase
VLAVADDSFEVAAQGGSIVVKRVRPEGGKKMAAGGFAKEAGLKEGARLGG